MDTTQLIARSVVRSSVDAESHNQRINPQVPDDIENGEGKDMILSSLNEILSVLKGKKVSPKFNPTDLIGYSYVKDHDDMLQRATITDVNTDDGILELTYASDNSLEMLDYNTFINTFNAKDEDGDELWSFKEILDHRMKCGKWELEILWDTGETTWELLSEMKLTDLVSVAKYAHDHDLTSTPGWKWSKQLKQGSQKLMRMARVFKSQAKYNLIKYKYGVQVPRNMKEALEQDRKFGNSK